MQNRFDASYYAPSTTATRSGLLAKVAGLLAFSMAFTAAGAVVGIQMPELSLPALIGVLILSFVVGFARNVQGLNLVLMYTLTVLMGVGLGGILDSYLMAGAGGVVIEAAGTTALLTLGLSVYAVTTKTDLTGLGSKLFLGVIALIAVSVVSIFVQATILDIIIGLAGSVIFSLYIPYYIQRSRTLEDTLPNAIIIAIGLYLSVINLFLSLLRLFTAVGGGGSRR